MYLAYQRPALPEIKHLFEELEKVGPSLMKNKGVGNETHPKPRFFHADTELDVFGEPVKFETACSFENLPGYAHVKASRLKPTDPLLAPAYAARCKNRRHGISHRPL